MKRFKKTDMRRIFGRDGPRQKRKAPTQLLDKFRSPVGLSRAGHRFVLRAPPDRTAEMPYPPPKERELLPMVRPAPRGGYAFPPDPLTGKLVDRFIKLKL